MFLSLRSKDMTVIVNNEPAKLIWIRDVVEDIYEVSVQYVSGSKADGFHLWYVRMNENGECEFIACSLYLDETVNEIRNKEAQAKPGRELLAKLGIR